MLSNKTLLIIVIALGIILIGLIAAFALIPTPAAKESADNSNAVNNSNSNMQNAQTNQTVILKTNFGDIALELFTADAPKTVENFIKLSKSGFYNGTKFHRVIKGFMIQGGDPNSKDDDWSNDGMGGPGYKFEDEINSHKLVRGVLAMANAGANTNGSQFFIVTTEATPHLDGKHTAFGKVLSGMDIVDKIESVKVNENDHPTDDVVVNSIEIKS
ncbi:MAG: peptidylprolyl isomerase [Patescibacteria group bacterium]